MIVHRVGAFALQAAGCLRLDPRIIIPFGPRTTARSDPFSTAPGVSPALLGVPPLPVPLGQKIPNLFQATTIKKIF